MISAVPGGLTPKKLHQESYIEISYIFNKLFHYVGLRLANLVKINRTPALASEPH